MSVLEREVTPAVARRRRVAAIIAAPVLTGLSLVGIQFMVMVAMSQLH